MQKPTISKSYAYAALLIHATNQEVTQERIESIFKTLGLEYSSKIASLFTLAPAKYVDMLSCTGSAAPVATTESSAAPVEAAAPEVAEESEDCDIDF